MTKERKRGVPFPSGVGRQEAQLVGPYPVWDAWKNNLFEALKRQGFQLTDSIEPVLMEYYTQRRLFQAGKITEKEFDEYLKQLDEERGEIFEDPVVNFAVSFIRDRTVTEDTKKVPGRR